MATSTATPTSQRSQLKSTTPTRLADSGPARVQTSRLSALEGRRVSVALTDGSRIDDCELVSAGRHQVRSLWLFTNGADRFVDTTDIIDVWESPICS